MHAADGPGRLPHDLTLASSVAPGIAPAVALPVAFKGIAGFLHPAGGAVGVVMCSPWGFEELCLRKGWRLLAEAIAAAGYPCLRFDYPGTGNSLGVTADITSLDDWTESVHRAAEFLRVKSGVRRFVFLGQSLGAGLAVAAAATRADVAGLQLIAPVGSGRGYARELAATSSLIAQQLGVVHEASAAEAISVVGFPLSQALLDSLRTFAPKRLDRLDGVAATIFDVSGRKAGTELLGQLRKANTDASLEPIQPFILMDSGAVTHQQLPVAAERVVAALRRAHPNIAHPNIAHLNMAHPLMVRPSARAAPAVASPTILAGDGFTEEPLRFGPDLFGILCQPARPRVGAPAVVLLNRGLNPHVGWRRVTVEHARALALAGIATLRFDNAGLGESRDAADRPADLMYSDRLVPDVRAAVDVLAARGHRRIALAGVCSGAYLALLAARHDPRVTEVFAVNPQRLVWNPAEDPEELIRYGLRTMRNYVGDIRGGSALRKLLRSRRRIGPALRFLLRRQLRGFAARVPLALRSALWPRSMAGRVRDAFDVLAAAGTRVALVYSAGDPGLDELRQYFGPIGRDLRHASVTVVPDADHNLTSTGACERMLALLLRFAGVPASSPQIAEPALAVTAG